MWQKIGSNQKFQVNKIIKKNRTQDRNLINKTTTTTRTDKIIRIKTSCLTNMMTIRQKVLRKKSFQPRKLTKFLLNLILTSQIKEVISKKSFKSFQPSK